jgi:methylated-DNA-[protein]-cysteine S-methyltransferase
VHVLSDLRNGDGIGLSELRWGALAAPPASTKAMSDAGREFWIDEVECPLGTVLLVARDGKLVCADYADCRHRMLAHMTRCHGAIELKPTVDPFGFSSRIRAYFEGRLDAITEISVNPGGTAFQRKLWTALRRIPAGRTLTYSDAASRMGGRPTAARAVGAANARNPIALVIPCHRLVGSDNTLTGYAGGLWRKRWLLEHEEALSGVAEPARTRSAVRG